MLKLKKLIRVFFKKDKKNITLKVLVHCLYKRVYTLKLSYYSKHIYEIGEIGRRGGFRFRALWLYRFDSDIS